MGKQAENLAKYCGKGSKIAVSGKLIQQTWEYEGKKQSKVLIQANNVMFLDTKKETTPVEKIEKKEEDPYTDFGNSINEDEIELTDDMLPF